MDENILDNLFGEEGMGEEPDGQEEELLSDNPTSGDAEETAEDSANGETEDASDGFTNEDFEDMFEGPDGEEDPDETSSSESYGPFDEPKRKRRGKKARRAKGWLIAISLVLSVGFIVFLGVCVYLKDQKPIEDSEKASGEADQVQDSEEELNLALLPAYEGEMFPIRMLDSDSLVYDYMYIEGLSEVEASWYNNCLRHYEEAGGDEAAEVAGDLAWVYEQLEPKLRNWFNPDYDLVGAFMATEHTEESDGAVAWMTVPLYQELQRMSEEDITKVFFFREDEALGGYRMSQCYFLLGFSTASEELNQLP